MLMNKILFLIAFIIFDLFAYCQYPIKIDDTSFYGVYSEFPYSSNGYFINSQNFIVNSGSMWEYYVYKKSNDTLLLFVDSNYHEINEIVLDYRICVLKKNSLIVHYYDYRKTKHEYDLFRLNFWLKFRSRVYRIFHRRERRHL